MVVTTPAAIPYYFISHETIIKPMSVSKPYHLTVRQFADDWYDEGGRAQYIKHHKYSKKPSNYIRAYLLLQKDLIDLFNYVEPADQNIQTFSFRIQELFIRTCIEIESNFKAILSINKYSKASNTLNMEDYFKVNKSHYLSWYDVKVPYWTGDPMTAARQPFKHWSEPEKPKTPWTLPWYKDYTSTKHDRANSLHLSTFENLIDAFSALVALITSQYLFEDFSSGHDYLVASNGIIDGYDPAIGDYFRVYVPKSIPADERYDFNWFHIREQDNPFQQFDYDSI